MPCRACRARQVRPDRLASSPCRRARQRDGEADALRPPARVAAPGPAVAPGGGHRDRRLGQSPDLDETTHRGGHGQGQHHPQHRHQEDGDRKPIPSRIIRSARSISPPRAEMPSDSALARW